MARLAAQTVAGQPDQLQIMYGIAGERRLYEWTADWLPGHFGSGPVRIGNAAHSQKQLDVFGEVIDALHQARAGGLPENAPAWSLQRALVDHLETIWRKPDHGMWEVRARPRHFTYSKVMAWVAVDRCVRSIEEFGLAGPLNRWKRLRAEMHAEICEKGYDAGRGTFVQAYGEPALDANLLLLPTLGFLPAADPRFRRTVAAIERDLLVDGLVRRYRTDRTDDGVEGSESAFIACSFWLVDAYAMLGRTNEARDLFERLLALQTDVGLLAEEYDTAVGCQRGNFPQAFSHVALVGSASRLSRYTKPQERSPKSSEDR